MERIKRHGRLNSCRCHAQSCRRISIHALRIERDAESGDFGAWSDWSDSYISSSSNIQVETRQVKTGARYLVAHYCTGDTGDDNKYKSANWKFDSRCAYHELGWYSGEKSLGTQVDGERCSNTCWKYFVMDTETLYKTQYRSRTVSTTYYYKWSDWSSWSDSSITGSSTREVQTRTVYRYCDRTRVPTYHFQRWGSWSSWTTQPAASSATKQVESSTFYRYRDKVDKQTYIFYRWTDWSDWSETPIEETDDNEVETQIMYRYKSK